MEEGENIILHIIVVGFHHKKGYQVEFTHPQWPTGEECPPEWAHLPSVAMPDGSHNYHQETVYFHLPPIEGTSETVYGVSCYRQIDADRVVNRTEDITRKSVQKSVIALSRLPLFGQIQVKLELITSAYFETGDFSQVEVLRKAYNNLNQCLTPEMVHSPQVFVGLSARDLVLTFRHKLLVLFKLALLERRVLVQHSPVSELGAAVLALASLIPQMVQSGLTRASLQPPPPTRRISTPAAPAAGAPASNAATAGRTAGSEGTPAATSAGADITGNSTFYRTDSAPATAPAATAADSPRRASHADVVTGKSTFYQTDAEAEGTGASIGGGGVQPPLHRSHSDGAAAVGGATRASVFYDTAEAREAEEAAARASTFYLGSGAAPEVENQQQQQQEQQTVDARVERLLAAAHNLDDQQCGMPLKRFRKGHLCHPYLCLSDIHLLSDAEVLTFLAGATNVLYSHKRHLVDAYITMAPCSVELSPPLRRQLALSTEDLRFADLLVRAVCEPGSAGGTGGSASSSPADSPTSGRATAAVAAAAAAGTPDRPPRGSDAWLRAVFRLYLYMMLRTALMPDGSPEHALYNTYYISALKETPSFVQWAEGRHPGVLEVNPGHPCSGQLSMADMKLRISQTFQSSERGRKVTQVAAMTGRAVGGALTVARGALSSWWSSLATPEEATPPAEPALDAAAEISSPAPAAHAPAASAAATLAASTAAATGASLAPSEARPARPRFEPAPAPSDGQAVTAASCP